MAAIEQTISPLGEIGHRGVDTRDDFVAKTEAVFDQLHDSTITEINNFGTQANSLRDEVNTLRDATVTAKDDAKQFAKDAADSAILAQGAANYKGDWDSDTTYMLAESITYTDGERYVSKIDDNDAEPTSGESTDEWDFISLSAAPLINTPTITSPADGDTDVNIHPSIEGSSFTTNETFKGVLDESLVDIADADDFSNVVYSGVVSGISGLEASTTYYVRLRYSSDNHLSGWSSTISFTTEDAGIETPSVTNPTDEATDIGKNPTFSFSDYTQVGGNDEDHLSTSVQVSDTDDFSNIITETVDDEDNLTSWKSGDLEVSTTYYVRVKFKSTNYESDWSDSISFTTKDSFSISAGGFNFSVVPSEEDFDSLNLKEMDGTNDDTSDNYGNYEDKDNGSIMCHIKKFYYRVGHSDSPQYDDYGDNALDISYDYSDESEANDNGFILPRAFIDGSEEKAGFFFDKYMSSQEAADGDKGISVFGGVPISLTTNDDYTRSATMEGCDGKLYDAVTLSKARGTNYNTAATFMHGALALLTTAHAQASTSTDNCAWYDSEGSTNYPKGCNDSLADTDDADVTYDSAGDAGTDDKPKTGATNNFNRTTHNGCANGVADLNGGMYEVTIGLTNIGDSETASDAIDNDDIYVLKQSVAHKDLTGGWDGDNDVWGNTTHIEDLYDKVTSAHALGSDTGSVYWGSGTNAVFSNDQSGVNRDVCGFIPKDNDSTDDTGTNQFGTDYMYRYNRENMAVRCCGGWGSSSSAGLFCRDFDYTRSYGDDYSSFRAAAYA